MLGAQPMKRRSPALLAGLVVGCVILLALNQAAPGPTKLAEPTAPGPAGKTEPTETSPASPTPERAPSPNPAEAHGSGDPSAVSKRFQLMPDGSPVPALRPDAPQRVKLGVALFRYEGTEAPPKSTRSKADALSLAQKATLKAKDDFEAAVQMGDPGSSDNLGWIGRDILEPAVEFAVFSTEMGQVASAPIDTPRGFWVVKRVR